MSEPYDLEDMGGAVDVLAAATEAGIRRRRGLRITLLSLAAAILVLGAAAAGAFGYVTLAHG